MSLLDRRLEAFVTVAQAGSISHAARELQVSQPALSQTISSLERDLGFRLFARTQYGVALTDAGRVLYATCEESLGKLQRAVGEARRRTAPSKTLNIGTNYQCSGVICNAVCPTFRRNNPDIEIVVHDIPDDRTILSGLAAGYDIVEAARATNMPESVSFLACTTEPLVLCVPPGHRLAGLGRPIGVADLEGETVGLFPPGILDSNDGVRRLINALPFHVDIAEIHSQEFSGISPASGRMVIPCLARLAPKLSPMVALQAEWIDPIVLGLATPAIPSPAALLFLEEARRVYRLETSEEPDAGGDVDAAIPKATEGSNGRREPMRKNR